MQYLDTDQLFITIIGLNIKWLAVTVLWDLYTCMKKKIHLFFIYYSAAASSSSAYRANYTCSETTWLGKSNVCEGWSSHQAAFLEDIPFKGSRDLAQKKSESELQATTCPVTERCHIPSKSKRFCGRFVRPLHKHTHIVWKQHL